MKIGYHAAHEQFPPSELLRHVAAAEQAGFSDVMCSDHFQPWSTRQGHSGNAIAWLGAVMQATTSMNFGTLAIPGGFRSHPAVLAQAYATLADLFPGRFGWIAAGSGEAMNEAMTGEGWPGRAARIERMEAGIDMLRRLWRGETVTMNRAGIRAENARLWSLPARPPAIYAAVLSAASAAAAGKWADGLLTVRKDKSEMAEILAAFRESGGAGKPALLQLQISWAESLEQAEFNAHDQWRHAAAGPWAWQNCPGPEMIDAMSAALTPKQMHTGLFISHDLSAHLDHIRESAEGFDYVFLHNAGRNQPAFIEAFGRALLPALRADAA